MAPSEINIPKSQIDLWEKELEEANAVPIDDNDDDNDID